VKSLCASLVKMHAIMSRTVPSRLDERIAHRDDDQAIALAARLQGVKAVVVMPHAAGTV